MIHPFSISSQITWSKAMMIWMGERKDALNNMVSKDGLLICFFYQSNILNWMLAWTHIEVQNYHFSKFKIRFYYQIKQECVKNCKFFQFWNFQKWISLNLVVRAGVLKLVCLIFLFEIQKQLDYKWLEEDSNPTLWLKGQIK